MKKTRILTAFLSLTLLASLSLTGCGKSKETTTLLMADVQEGEHPTAIACDEFAEMVYKRTNGRINIEVYHGDTLGSEAEQMQQLTVGGLDLARLSGPISNYNPEFKAFQALYLYDSEDDMWDILNSSVGDELLNSKEFDENNLVGLCWFSGGSRNFYNSKKEIKSPKDLEGLTFRVTTDSMFALLEKNGATGKNIAYNDILSSISDGVIDGAENNWPSYISTEHYKVAKYITIDQHCCIPEMIIASKSSLESLSQEDQDIIKECAKEISAKQIKAMKDYEEEAMKKAEKEGVTITYLSDEASKEFHKQGAEIYQEISADLMDTIKHITK